MQGEERSCFAASPVCEILEPRLLLGGDQLAWLMKVPTAGAEVLTGVDAVAAGPDGLHVYVAAPGDNAVSVFYRDATTGGLTEIQSLQDGQNGVDGLAGACSVIVSPDGKNVYAAGRTDKAVAVFSVDPATGLLAFRQMLTDGVSKVGGLEGVTSLTVSPDGRHVYAAGSIADAVAVFRRNPSTGALTFLQALRDGQGGVDGLDGADAVTVSADGKSLYATGSVDDAVAVFRRNPYSGMLTFTQVLKDGVAGVDGLDGASAVAVSPDGKHVYTAANADNAVTLFTRDAATGKLLCDQVIRNSLDIGDGLRGASAVALSPNGSYVYAAAAGSNAVTLFRRDATTGRLTACAPVIKDGVNGADGLLGVCALSATADGEHLYAAGAGDNRLAVLGTPNRAPVLDNTGTMALMVTPNDQLDDPGTLISAMIASAGGDRITDSDLGDREGIAVVGVDNTSGRWQYWNAVGMAWADMGDPKQESALLLAAGTRIRFAPHTDFTGLVANGITFRAWDETVGAPGDRHDASQGGGSTAFSTAMETAQVTVTRRRLAFTGYISQGDKIVPGQPATILSLSGPESAAVSPDGQNVYVVAKQSNALTVLSRNVRTGALTYVEAFTDGENGVDGLGRPRAVTVSPDGKNVYAAGKDENAIAVFQRNAATGRLVFLQAVKNGQDGVSGLLLPHAVVISPDGKNAYVAGHDADSLVVFRRNPATGGLTFLQVLTNGVNKVKGLRGIEAATVSPDGRFVYTAASNDDAVAIFARQPATGVLTYIDCLKDGRKGIDGLLGAVAVAVSADGRTLYAAGAEENALAVFQRNALSGRLTLVQVLRDGLGGIEGLAGANSVSVCPDGRHVYVAARADCALAVFTRDPVTGRLAPEQVISDMVGGTWGLMGAYSVTVSADGRSVYVAGFDSSAVVGFQVLNSAPVLDTSGFPMLDFVAPDDVADPGTPVSAIIARLGGSGITDEDPRDPKGIAVIAADIVYGSWQYTLDGNTWSPLGSPSEIAAVLLPADARIRFVPESGFAGVVRGGLQVRAWDQRTGVAGGTADTRINGDRAAFSRNVEEVDVGVFRNCRMGGGQPRRLTYTDADGSRVTVTLSAGAAQAGFTGSADLTFTAGRSGWTVTGTNVEAAAILLTDTPTTSRLSFTTRGGAEAGASVGTIVVCSSLGTVSGAGIDLRDSLLVGGTLGTLRLDDIPGPCGISVGGRSPSGAGVAMTFDRVTDLVVDSAMPIRSLTATEWLATTKGASGLTASWVGRLTITGRRANSLGVPGAAGDFQASVRVTSTTARQALGALAVAGWLDKADIFSAGPVGTVIAGGMRDSSVTAGDMAAGHASIAGLTVKGLKGGGPAFINSHVSGWTLGTISVKAVQTVNAGHVPAAFGIQGHTITSYARDAKKYPSKGSPGFVVDQADDYTVQLV